jgi:SAM-dependent methyltransferase
MEDIEKQIKEEFLSVRLRPQTMLFYTVRTAILESVREETASFYGTVLDVGCGFMPYKKLVQSNPKVEKYIGMDLAQSSTYGQIEPDLTWNGEKIPLADESVDCVMATEFLEHYSEPEKILREIRRVMRTEGRLFATVPFIWNLHEIPHDEYRYTPYSVERHLQNAGFRDIQIKALGGWNRSLAQMIGLWLGFSKMRGLTRTILKNLLFPVYVWLVKTDRKPTEFDGYENSMFSGLTITARK